MKQHLFTTALAAALIALAAAQARATIYGTMSNFDVFNETPEDAYGAELDLEGCHAADIVNTFPSHFDHRTVTEYNNGTTFGTLIDFTGYNFSPNGFIPPTPGTSTNGHMCVDTPGCEHFGFSVSANPTATQYFWLDQLGQRIGNTPMSVPTPTWTYLPPAVPGAAPEVKAEIEVQQSDAMWMKVFETQLDRPVMLNELMSGNPIVPEAAAEVETEWELLENGAVADAQNNVDNGKEAVVRRYEFYKYSGAYSNEHEALSQWNGQGDPPANELGDFISANMVAANLVDVPQVPGDYNGDGVVNAADYTVWRDHLGSEVNTEIDGDKSGIVDEGDYEVWKQNFGQHAGAGALGGAGNAAVPEPATSVLALLATALLTLCHGRHRI
jgi:hypothetical protein